MSDREKKQMSPLSFIIATVIVVGLIVWGFNALSNSIDASDKAAAAQQAADAAKRQQDRQPTIDAVAPVFCQNHKNTLMSDIAYLKDAGWPVHTGSRAWTAAECITIISKLYDAGTSVDDLQKVAQGKIHIGMNQNELIYSWGAPRTINNTTTAGGNSGQWVYGDPAYGANYVYLNNGMISSMQTQ